MSLYYIMWNSDPPCYSIICGIVVPVLLYYIMWNSGPKCFSIIVGPVVPVLLYHIGTTSPRVTLLNLA